MTMQLLATRLSHYSRKVRILLDHYGLAYELVDVGNVASPDPAQFDGNPLMKIPVLKDQGRWLIESDHIAAYLVRTYDPTDRYEVLTTDPATLNARAVLNGVMAEEVKVILAERTGLDTAPHAFFHKARAAIDQGLRWLEARAASFRPAQPRYLEFHLVCLWDHLTHYQLVPLDYPGLASVAAALRAHEAIRRTAP